MSSYYFPNLLLTDTKIPNRERKDEIDSIKFRHDMVDSEYLFLSDFWPDVKEKRKTCSKWNLPINKYPLFECKRIGSFRTIKHYYYYQLFQTIDKNYSKYFLWSHRHEAAKIYYNHMKPINEKKIQTENNKVNPSQSKIHSISSEWNLSLQNGLRAKEAIRIASWPCYKKFASTTEKRFKQSVLYFQNRFGIHTYATAIDQMYHQDQYLKRALIEGTGAKMLVSVGNFQKMIWDTYSANGHNLLGELHMHYRNEKNRKSFIEKYNKKLFCYSTSYTKIHPSPSPSPSPSPRKNFNNNETKVMYLKQLHHKMVVAAQNERWEHVLKLCKSIHYLCTNV